MSTKAFLITLSYIDTSDVDRLERNYLSTLNSNACWQSVISYQMSPNEKEKSTVIMLLYDSTIEIETKSSFSLFTFFVLLVIKDKCF